MAEEVLQSIAVSLLAKLSSATAQEFSIVWNSKSEIKKLQSTINTIRDVLQDAERRQSTDEAVRGWLDRLKHEIYRADDLFDELTAMALRKRTNKMLQEVRLFCSTKNQFAFHIRTAHKVKDLRHRLDDIAKDINQFKFLVGKIESQMECNGQRNEQSYSFVRQDEIIGREKDKEEMIQILLDESSNPDQRVSVVTIFGMGGLGKTALAQLLYNDKQIQDHFRVRLWACVHYFSNLNGVLEKIVASGSNKKPSGLELDQLASMLMSKIRGQRFLLVLDDVWDDVRENWLKLERLLDVGAQGSKVLLTTRLEIVATNIGSANSSLQLGGLSETNAWSLFVKMAFVPLQSKQMTSDSSQFEPDDDLETLGRQIVKKCGNVPLAIRCVGSYLCHKDKKQWSFVLNNELAKVIPEKHNHIRKFLMISYNDLPPSLKLCFAYCSLFPKDHQFSQNSLVHLWMAQGFLDHQSHNQRCEDVGERYVSYLIERCFFQDVTENYSGDVRTFKMHDLMHDLAIDVAGNESLLINNVDLDEVKGRNLRHVAYGCEVDFSQGVQLEQKLLRTLLFHDRRVFNRSVLGRLMQMRGLRTLDLSYLQMEKMPNSMGELVHLRYLDLSGNTALTVLPYSICKLQLLQTLNLCNCSQLMNLPNNLHKLIRLRHLLIQGCEKLTHMPSRIASMTSIVTLDKFVVNKHTGGLRSLAQLNNLSGQLEVELPKAGWQTCIIDSEKFIILQKKVRLQYLNLRWSGDDMHLPEEHAVIVDCVLELLQPSSNLCYLKLLKFPGTRVSSWASSLDNLISLEIYDCPRCLQLPSFSKLPKLKTLRLNGIPLVEYMEDATNFGDVMSFFASLLWLYIEEMPNLKGWWRQEKPQSQQLFYPPWFPRLSGIYIFYCPKLACIPSFPCAEEVCFTKVNHNLLRQPTVMENASSSSRSCQLKHMYLNDISNLVSLPNEWIIPVSTLRSLEIRGCEDFESLSTQLLQHLTALEKLVITLCPKLDLFTENESSEMLWKMLPKLITLGLDFGGNTHSASHFVRGLHQLTALEELEIFGYEPNSDEGDRIMWIAPTKLKRLIVSEMYDVAHYVEVFQQLDSIEDLAFRFCLLHGDELDAIPWEALKSVRTLSFQCNKFLKSLPDGRCHDHLPLLRHLKLENCVQLESLPSWVSRLQSLEIIDCPLLNRYKKPMGECWHEIRHIPNVYFR